MHFEILVEDQSGRILLDNLVPRIIGDANTFIVHPYKGLGRIPKNMKDSRDASKRILMDNLPKLLKGYGKRQSGRPDYPETVVVVCDLDEKCLKAFRNELLDILNACSPRPEACFCIAIEEGEAWLLGDIHALKKVYPRAKDSVLKTYKNDSICGTWEKMADAIYPGGAVTLSRKGWQVVGAEKSKWAEEISPQMDVENNGSPSFVYFREKLRTISGSRE